MASSAIRALDSQLETPSPYTVAIVHRHNGRWSVTLEQGTLEKGESPSRFLNRRAAEVFFYDRVLHDKERAGIDEYVLAHYSDVEEKASDGSDEGIHVAGRWNVEVRNPDGSLDQRHVFQNSLVDSLGPTLLSNLLTGDRAVGLFRVTIAGSLDTDDANGHLCVQDDGSRAPCVLVEASDPADEADEIQALEVVGHQDIVLEGSFIAERNGRVEMVGTEIGECSADTAPASCIGTSNPLTEQHVSGPGNRSPDVEAGQQVSVEVVIGFD